LTTHRASRDFTLRKIAKVKWSRITGNHLTWTGYPDSRPTRIGSLVAVSGPSDSDRLSRQPTRIFATDSRWTVAFLNAFNLKINHTMVYFFRV